MNTFKVYFEDGKGKENNLITGFNGTLKEAKEYYLNDWFNFGCEDDLMMKGVKVEVA